MGERKRDFQRVRVPRGQHQHNKQSSVRGQSLASLVLRFGHCRPAPLFPIFPGPKQPCACREKCIRRSVDFPLLSSRIYKVHHPPACQPASLHASCPQYLLAYRRLDTARLLLNTTSPRFRPTTTHARSQTNSLIDLKLQ